MEKTDRGMLDMQLFAEGAADGNAAGANTGVTGADAALQRKGVKSNPLADVKYGIQEETPPDAGAEQQAGEATPPDREQAFEALIKGEYKDLYDRRMQEAIRKRLRSTQETVDRYNALTPTMEMLAKKYGVKAGDIEGLNRAIEEDDSYYEEEAAEKGLSVEQLKEIKRMERENRQLRQAMNEQESRENANRLYQQWMQQEQQMKQVYPAFDLNEELADENFLRLMRSGVDMKTAYEVIHKDDILPAAMQFAAKKVEQKLTNKMRANGARPTENGVQDQSASLTKPDVRMLTKADRAEIARRVARGEKIRF